MKNEINEAINLGDEVIVTYKDAFNILRYKKYNKQKAVIVKYLPETAPFVFFLRFINEETNLEYLDDGGFSFRPEWVTKIGHNERVYKKWLKEEAHINKKNQKDIVLCKICGEAMVLNKGALWCPSCNKPSVLMVPVLNLNEAGLHLESLSIAGIKDRIRAHINGDASDGSLIKMQLSYTDEERAENLGLSDEVVADLLVIKDVFKIDSNFIYFEI